MSLDRVPSNTRKNRKVFLRKFELSYTFSYAVAQRGSLIRLLNATAEFKRFSVVPAQT